MNDPAVDAEVIDLAWSLIAALRIAQAELVINSVGCAACRPKFQEALLAALGDDLPKLCRGLPAPREDQSAAHLRLQGRGRSADHRSAAALGGLPLRAVRDALRGGAAAPDRRGAFRGGSRTGWCAGSTTTRGRRSRSSGQTLGAQNALLGGGRYDGLVKDLGGPDRTGIGFAAGLERLVLALPEGAAIAAAPRAFVVAIGDDGRAEALRLLRELRQAGLPAQMELEARGVRAQMKRADRLAGARHADRRRRRAGARRSDAARHADRRSARACRARASSRPREQFLTEIVMTTPEFFVSNAHLRRAARRRTSGSRVVLLGWVHRVRDLGGLIFFDVRDRYGLTQVVVRDRQPGGRGRRHECGPSSWSRSTGRVDARSAETVNPKVATGEVEVVARSRRDPERGEDAAVSDQRRHGGRRGDAAALPLSRPAPARAAAATSCCGTRSRSRRGGTSTARASSRSRRRSSRGPRPKARATTSCRAACTRASSSRCRSRRRSSSRS